jgi:hypothetical protein
MINVARDVLTALRKLATKETEAGAGSYGGHRVENASGRCDDFDNPPGVGEFGCEASRLRPAKGGRQKRTQRGTFRRIDSAIQGARQRTYGAGIAYDL